MKSDEVKKNLLDLSYNKYLQYFTTVIVLIFTYITGIFIAFFTKQIDYKNGTQLLLIFFISTIFLMSSAVTLIIFKNKLKIIFIEIGKLAKWKKQYKEVLREENTKMNG